MRLNLLGTRILVRRRGFTLKNLDGESDGEPDVNAINWYWPSCCESVEFFKVELQIIRIDEGCNS